MPQQIRRRTVLMGACTACGLALLPACAAGGNGDSRTPGSAGAATPSTGAPGSPSSAALTAAADVPVGGGTVVAGALLVVQPSAGVFKAYDAHCPHTGTIVGVPDSAGVITCPNHGARYRAADGSLIDGPAPRGLTQVPVRVVAGQVERA